MTPFDAPVASAWACGLVFLRAAGLCLTVPVLSARVVPVRVRIAFAAMLAFAAWSGAGAPTAPPPESLASLL
jgi:flagellar biosynthesis protein FliR